MSKGAALVTVIIVSILIIGYLIFMFESFRNNKWIFQPYVPKAPPNSCYPQISVTTPTQDEENNAKANISKINLPPSN